MEIEQTILGSYRLLDELGRGGMGRVYKALHTIMDRVVAVKVIAPELVEDSVAIAWFRREMRASTRLIHPNIVMAFDANEADGLHFLVMEYVAGGTLDTRVKQHGPLPVQHACALVRQTALALQHAHEKGMVHRDIKPANLLLPHGEGEQADEVLVKLVDFGLARLQGTAKSDTISPRGESGVLGTPDYIAPEQSRDIHAADIRSDLYSLGCVFYFALTGRVPFPGANATEKLIKHLMEQPEPVEKIRPDVPPAVAAIVRRLMAKRPGDRYQTPAELVRELDLWLTEQSREVPPRSAHTRILDHIEVFTLSPRPSEASASSFLESLEKSPPGNARQQETDDTSSFSHVDDTEVITAEATALEKWPSSVAGGDGGDTLREEPAPASLLPARKAQRIDPVLRRLWERWTNLVAALVAGRGPWRVNDKDYRILHVHLLQVCRAAVESAAMPERRAFYQELLSIAQPWLRLQTFVATEPPMLAALLERCRQSERELNGGKTPWTLRQCIGLVLLMLGPAGLAVWYWNAGRFWLPSLLRSFRWDSSSLSLRSVWVCLQIYPSLLMGAIFPLVIALSIYLLLRGSRL